MKSKNKNKNKKQQQPQIKNNKKNNKKEKTNEIEKNDKENKDDENNINEYKNKNEQNLNDISNKKLSPMVFISNDNLQGFHFAFIMMIILPLATFFTIRNILKKLNFTKNQQDVYGVVGVLVSVWFILISYIIYYFRNDFYTVFCKKKEKIKEE